LVSSLLAPTCLTWDVEVEPNMPVMYFHDSLERLLCCQDLAWEGLLMYNLAFSLNRVLATQVITWLTLHKLMYYLTTILAIVIFM